MDTTSEEQNPILTALWGGSYSGSMEGGITIGGSADVSGSYTEISLVVGGQADVTISFSLPTSGGVTIGGTADCKLIIPYTGSGGIIMGGQASPNISLSYTGSGGVTVSGTAIEQENFSYTMSGGVVLGGQAALRNSYSYAGSGGISVSGQWIVTQGELWIMRGGITMGGQAVVHLTIPYTMSGGVTTGGQAGKPHFVIPYTGSGGVTVSGSAKAIWGFAYTMLGGVTLSGQCGNGSGLQVGYGYVPEFPHNRIFVYGKASCGSNSFSYTMSGGVSIGGLGKIDFCSFSCDLDNPFYRSSEAQSGCQIILPNGKIDYVCARPLLYMPQDKIKRSNPLSGIVPGVTVCRQGLSADPNKKNCGQFIRK